LIERWFCALTTTQLRCAAFQSVAHLIATIATFITHHNDHPRSFTWTANVADILAKGERARAVLHKLPSV
jgi:hypothetical protein